MNNNNSDDFLKGFSAVDSEDRIDRIDPTKEDPNRPEPTFGDRSISNNLENDDGFTEPSFCQSNYSENNYSQNNFSDNSYQENSFKQSRNASNERVNAQDNIENPNKKDKKPKKEKSIKKKLIYFGLKVGVVGVVILALLFVYFDSVVLSKFGVDDKWVLPAVVYSRPLELYPDQKLSLKQMEYELKLLKYRKVNNPQKPGEYATNPKTGRVVILRRPFEFPDGAENTVSLLVTFNGQRVAQIINADSHEELGYVRMDPVLLDRINRIDPKEDRIFIQLSEVPEALVTTLLEIEDRSFRTNIGVNFFAIARAFIKNAIAHSVVEGGSTITQQLVKNYFLNSQKSYTRKFKEIIMALIMNHRYTKDQILEAYMNEIYLGQNGPAGIYGFGLASYFYFGVPISELTQDQMALLVGIIKGPSYYDPWRHPDQALERRNTVLAV